MISFKKIKRYSDYKSYQQIKQINVKQCVRNTKYKKNCSFPSYQEYLNKKVGYQCCTKGIDCCYCLNGENSKKEKCLNPPVSQIDCECENNELEKNIELLNQIINKKIIKIIN